MLDKFPMFIEFHNLNDKYGQYLPYFFYDHFIWGKFLEKEKKRERGKKKKREKKLIKILFQWFLKLSNREFSSTNVDFHVNGSWIMSMESNSN